MPILGKSVPTQHVYFAIHNIIKRSTKKMRKKNIARLSVLSRYISKLIMSFQTSSFLFFSIDKLRLLEKKKKMQTGIANNYSR